MHAGAALLLQSRFDAQTTARALREGQLTVLHGVPTLYTRLLTQLERDVAGPFPTLRYAYAGGAALDLELKRRVERCLGVPVHHGYGMTEYAGSMFITDIDRPRGDALPGKRATNCEVRFVNVEGVEPDTGTPGEIWVRGPGTMLGYYLDPALTR